MTRERILVVEDEFILAANLSESLTRLGYEVVGTASSREEAQRSACAERPDLVLMDIQLRGERLGGVEAARFMRSRLGLPVVFLTAHSDVDTLQQAKLAEPFGYLLKPTNERELYSAIETGLFKHAMERQLAEQREWLATVLRSIGDAVIATDTDGLVRVLNPVAETLTGWSEEEARGRPLSEVFKILDGTTREPAADPVARVFESGAVVGLPGDTALVARDGTERLIADSAAPIRNPEGRTLGAVLVFRDVTVDRRLEEELARVQRLDSIALLAGGVAHDFNNLLTAILGTASVGRLSSPEGPQGELFHDIERVCLQARGLTQQLLAFARAGEPVRKREDIRALLAETAEFVLRGSRCRLALELPDELWPAEVDASQVGQVITNLVLNADAAMPRGGVVTVRARNATIGPDDPSLLRPGPYLVFEVVDEGIGIAPANLEHVFEPYFTTKQQGKGLGLASAYSIVRRHEGHIAVRSRLGQGSTFTVTLPALTDAAPAPPHRPELLRAEEPSRVLVLDDDPRVRGAVERILRGLGYEPVAVADGAEAVTAYEAARQAGDPFAVVILDLTVAGGLGGLDTLQELRRLDPEVCAVVSSGYSSDPVMADYAAHGFRDALPKPYALERLAEVLRELSRGRDAERSHGGGEQGEGAKE
ncbi:MAG: response regulator [Planctomycetota bacterium]